MLLMAAIRGIDNESAFSAPESTDDSNVHCLFSVRNMFFFALVVPGPFP
jgi:hypothetical protein